VLRCYAAIGLTPQTECRIIVFLIVTPTDCGRVSAHGQCFRSRFRLLSFRRIRSPGAPVRISSGRTGITFRGPLKLNMVYEVNLTVITCVCVNIEVVFKLQNADIAPATLRSTPSSAASVRGVTSGHVGMRMTNLQRFWHQPPSYGRSLRMACDISGVFGDTWSWVPNLSSHRCHAGHVEGHTRLQQCSSLHGRRLRAICDFADAN
jgi:hypothetical protein